MGYSRIARVSTDIETTFATTQAYTYRDQRAHVETANFNLVEAVLPDPTVNPRLHSMNQHKHGSKFGSTWDFTFVLDGLAQELDSATAFVSPQNGIAEVLKAAFGASSGDNGSTVVFAGSTVSVVNVAAAEGARFTAGSSIALEVTTDVFEVRRILDVTGDAITLHMDLSAVPTDGNDVLNGESFYLDEDNVGSDGDSLHVRFLGLEGGDQWLLRGVVPTVTFEMPINELLRMPTSFRVTDWTKTSGQTLAGATYVGGGPLPVVTAELQWGAAQAAVTTVARNILCAEEFTIDPGLVLEPESCLDGVETVKRWRMMKATPTATFAVRAFRNFDEFWTQFADETTVRSLGIQVGNTRGSTGTGMVYFHLPRCQYETPPQRTEGGGFVRAEVNLTGEEDQAASGGTEDQRVSAVSVTVF